MLAYNSTHNSSILCQYCTIALKLYTRRGVICGLFRLAVRLSQLQTLSQRPEITSRLHHNPHSFQFYRFFRCFPNHSAVARKLKLGVDLDIINLLIRLTRPPDIPLFLSRVWCTRGGLHPPIHPCCPNPLRSA